MNKYIVTAILALAAVAATGCCEYSREEGTCRKDAPEYIIRTYRASISSQTRTSLADDGNVSWSAGDTVRYYSTDGGAVGSCTVPQDGADAVLSMSTAASAAYLTAVYGGTSLSDNTGEGVTVKGAIPSVQSGKMFSEGHIAAVKSDINRSSLTFHNVTCYIKFTLTRTDVDKVVFSSNDGTAISGNGSIRLSFTDNSIQPSFAEDTSSSVTVNTGGNGTFFIATLPCTMTEGFTFCCYDAANTFLGSVTTERKVTLGSGTILNLGDIGGHFTAADNTEKVLFSTSATSYYPITFKYAYRIPAIASTRSGKIISISDYRYTHGQDVGSKQPIDILTRRSPDGGATWSEAATVVSCNESSYGSGIYGFGDASIVSDRTSDETLLMCVGDRDGITYGNGGHLEVHSFRSWDDGQTWSDHDDLTDQIYGLNPYWSTLFIASGKIFQSRTVKTGRYYRLYCAVVALNFGNSVLYSDDFGRNWNLLGSSYSSCCSKGDEAKVEELPDGTIILSSRRSGGRYFNIFSFTSLENGTGSWSSAKTDQFGAGSNSTNGEILAVKAAESSSGTACWIYLQSLPIGSSRTDVSIYWKCVALKDSYKDTTPSDFGSGWTRYQVTSSGRTSAYSTMCQLADGRIGLLYERDVVTNSSGYSAYDIVYQSFDLSTITGGNYRLRLD